MEQNDDGKMILMVIFVVILMVTMFLIGQCSAPAEPTEPTEPVAFPTPIPMFGLTAEQYDAILFGSPTPTPAPVINEKVPQPGKTIDVYIKRSSQ